MKSDEFNFLIENLSKEFETRVEAVKSSKYIDIDTFKSYREQAETIALDFINELYIDSNGRRTNSSGEYINDQFELVDYDSDNDCAINDKGEVIEEKVSRWERIHSGKKRMIYYNKIKIKSYISGIEFDFNFRDVLKKNHDLNKININCYLFLAFLSYQWGIHRSNLAGEEERSEGREYLFDALKFINMWMGGSTVLMINREYDEKKRALSNAAKLGGKKRAENYSPLKEKVVQLLLEHMPIDGWKSKSSAINAIIPDLCEFMKKSQKELPTKDWDTLPRTIDNWSRDDSEIKKAFTQVVKKRSSAKK